MNQIQFETNGLTVLAVPVGQDDYDFQMMESKFLYPGEFVLTYKSKVIWDKYQKRSWHWETKGQYKIHAVIDSMTEEQAKVLVKYDMNWDFKFGYQNYEATKDHVYEFPFDTAIAAIPGLLRSNGIDPAKKLVLLVCE